MNDFGKEKEFPKEKRTSSGQLVKKSVTKGRGKKSKDRCGMVKRQCQAQ